MTTSNFMRPPLKDRLDPAESGRFADYIPSPSDPKTGSAYRKPKSPFAGLTWDRLVTAARGKDYWVEEKPPTPAERENATERIEVGPGPVSSEIAELEAQITAIEKDSEMRPNIRGIKIKALRRKIDAIREKAK